MDFAYSDRVRELQECTRHFMQREVLPVNNDYLRIAESGRFPLALIDDLKAKAKTEGLWNLFLPGLRPDEPGTRLSNVEYAPLAEIIGRLPWASEVFNCSAPDTGNMELLHMFATPDQAGRWLTPLLHGDIRSSIRRVGDEYVINGRKLFITGALHPNCKLCIVLGVTDESADPHNRHSMVLVPMDTPGLHIARNVAIMHHYAPEGHCEVVLKDVRVPVSNLLGQEGNGFALAQARLGPGRVHHCMRTIGQCELALELMCGRALTRKAFGKHLSDFANVQDWIGHSRVEIDQARLLTLRAAWWMDRQGNQAVRVDVSAIKLVAANLQTRVLDRAIQVFGAMGLTPDTPLSYLWTWGRALHFVDGPDEVHLWVIARDELRRAKANLGATAAYYLEHDGA